MVPIPVFIPILFADLSDTYTVEGSVKVELVGEVEIEIFPVVPAE